MCVTGVNWKVKFLSACITDKKCIGAAFIIAFTSSLVNLRNKVLYCLGVCCRIKSEYPINSFLWKSYYDAYWLQVVVWNHKSFGSSICSSLCGPYFWSRLKTRQSILAQSYYHSASKLAFLTLAYLQYFPCLPSFSLSCASF